MDQASHPAVVFISRPPGASLRGFVMPHTEVEQGVQRMNPPPYCGRGTKESKRPAAPSLPEREGQRSLRLAMLAMLMLKALASKGPPHQHQ